MVQELNQVSKLLQTLCLLLYIREKTVQGIPSLT